MSPGIASSTFWLSLKDVSITLTHFVYFAAEDPRPSLRLCSTPSHRVCKSRPVPEPGRCHFQGPQPYSAVISTVPLLRISFMDLTGVNIMPSGAPLVNSRIDLRPRSESCGDSMSKALIVSCRWTQDAERLGTLIDGDSTGELEPIDLVFHFGSFTHLESTFPGIGYTTLTVGSPCSANGRPGFWWSFRVDMRPLVRVCMRAVIFTAKFSSLLQTASSSLPERRLVPATRM